MLNLLVFFCMLVISVHSLCNKYMQRNISHCYSENMCVITVEVKVLTKSHLCSFVVDSTRCKFALLLAGMVMHFLALPLVPALVFM